MSLHSQHLYRFDGFTIDADQRVLWQSGYRVQLTPKALDILLALVQRSGQVVDKETLMKGSGLTRLSKTSTLLTTFM